MRILVLGGDGYLGWPTALYFSRRGHVVAVLDNFAKRRWEAELDVAPLLPIGTLQERILAWREITGAKIQAFAGDLQEYDFVEFAVEEFGPDAIIHYGQQPSAPYSMRDLRGAVTTQVNNLVGTLNVLWAMKEVAPQSHLVKLGTMGEYGTPNIDIEEGFFEVEHKGRRDLVAFPKRPGSFYHLSKVHDSHNIMFASKTWELASTDLNQGIVYGIDTEETRLDERLATSFHYDSIFGTVLNRFCVQAVTGLPLTIYGRGGQRRGFLNIRDVIRCVELTVLNPARAGEYRVFNQFTETFSVCELAALVSQAASKLGLEVATHHLENPRVESEDHYYKPAHTQLHELGLQPHLLTEETLAEILGRIQGASYRVRKEIILPSESWSRKSRAMKARASL